MGTYHLSFIVWNVDPVFFAIGDFSIRYYSLFFALGTILAYKTTQQLFVHKTINQQIADKLWFYSVVGTFIGARLGHCLFYEPGYFLRHPAEIIFPFTVHHDGTTHFTGYQGLASHGAAIGILLAIVLFCYRYTFSFWKVADIIAMGILPACVCIRIGNLFNSEIIGKTTDAPWAFVFEHIDNLPRHPTQIYEALAYASIFCFLLWKHHNLISSGDGQRFGWFLVLLFSTRFLMEFLKEPQVNFETTMLFNMGQLLSLPFIIVGIEIIRRNNRQSKH